MYCKYCMRQIDDDVLFCPACGKPQKGSAKKPIYKRWWFWVIVVLIAIGIFGGGDEVAPSAQANDASISQSDIDEILMSSDFEQGTSAAPVIIDNTTLGEKNALRSAKSYLDFTTFSYSGLIDQLEYEGYSTSEATYAANNCGADWNEQALRAAKNYLDYTAFSYSGLVDQLEYEGFSFVEATYGVENCGADWNEQAAKCAESYLEYSSFSRQGLIDQLLYEGFTQQQAEYGVRSVGY